MNTFQKLAITFLFIATGTNFIEAKKSWFKKTWKATADSANKSFSKKKWDPVDSLFTEKDLWEQGWEETADSANKDFSKEKWDPVDSFFTDTLAQGFTDDVWDPNQNNSFDWMAKGWNDAFGCPVGMETNPKDGICYKKCKNNQHFSESGICHNNNAAKVSNLLVHPVPVIFYTEQ